MSANCHGRDARVDGKAACVSPRRAGAIRIYSPPPRGLATRPRAGLGGRLAAGCCVRDVEPDETAGRDGVDPRGCTVRAGVVALLGGGDDPRGVATAREDAAGRGGVDACGWRVLVGVADRVDGGVDPRGCALRVGVDARAGGGVGVRVTDDPRGSAERGGASIDRSVRLGGGPAAFAGDSTRGGS